MPKYELDALRAIRSMQQTHEIAGHGPMAERMRKIWDQVEALRAENEKLRAIISEATAALGNGSGCSAQASIEFMAGLPKEIALNTAALCSQRATLREALSDLLDRYIQAIGNEGIECYNARHALRISA